MAWLSLALSTLFGLLAMVVRIALHVRRTGRSPISRGAGASGRVALAAVSLLFIAGPLCELLLGVTPLAHGWPLGVIGVTLSLLGLAAMVYSQSAMGDSLRIGVDPGERTALITSGPFRWVRNPIYLAMIAYLAGVAALVPSLPSLAALALLALVVDLHVRLIEEPYLSEVHGEAYLRYAARVGRFLPRLGRLAAR